MRAAVYTETGPPDVMRVEEVDTPEPGAGEVRVAIAVSGVNPTDLKARSGATPDSLPETGFQTPGQDGAGTIDAVGGGVDPDRIGERVWIYLGAFGSHHGTAAEYCVVPAERAVPLRDASFDLGASLGVPAMTALYGLTADGPIGGETVLVSGGAGQVGHAAIELAGHLGATVIATVSNAEKAELARAAGADTVIDYHDSDAADQIRAAAPDGVSRVIEIALASNLGLDLEVIARGASIVSYSDTGGEVKLPPTNDLMRVGAVLRFILLYEVPDPERRRCAEQLTAALEAGILTALPLHRFPLDRIADAHAAAEEGVIGRVMIDVAVG